MNYFENIISFESLYKAHRRARLGKRHKKEVIEFEMELAKNLWEIHYELKYKRYKVGEYHKFMVYDPKEREIQAISYRDRIVQHSVCDNFLIPLLNNRLIYDNSACRKGKGTHFAIKRLRQFMTKHFKKCGVKGYFVKVDVSKYFASINHSLLMDKLAKLDADQETFNLLREIIYSYGYETGLPMGNQSSQCFALFYLDNVDRYIKEVKRVKYYVRYMDDMILLVEDKEQAQHLIKEIEGKLNENKLLINKKSQVVTVKNGIEFLGWRFRFSKSGKIIQTIKHSSGRRMLKKAKKRVYDIRKRKDKLELIRAYRASYKGHLNSGNSYLFWKKIDNVLLDNNSSMHYIK